MTRTELVALALVAGFILLWMAWPVVTSGPMITGGGF